MKKAVIYEGLACKNRAMNASLDKGLKMENAVNIIAIKYDISMKWIPAYIKYDAKSQEVSI